MTKEQEANMWARMVLLEKQVAELRILATARVQPRIEEPAPSAIEPPRDRYGEAVGREEM